jgi:hypothetical protein
MRALHLDDLSSTQARFWKALHAHAQRAMRQRFPNGRTYGAASADTFHPLEE